MIDACEELRIVFGTLSKYLSVGIIVYIHRVQHSNYYIAEN